MPSGSQRIYLSVVIVLIVLVSVSPGVYAWLKSRAS